MFPRRQPQFTGRANAAQTARPSLPETLPEPISLLATRCAAAGHLLARARLKEPLGPGEAHVLIHVFAHLGEEGCRFIHQVLAVAPDYDPDAVNRAIRAVSPTAIGCAGVRKALRKDAVPDLCHCVFRLPEDGYPAPLVHLDLFPRAAGKMTEAGPPAPDLDEDGRTYGYLSRKAKAAAQLGRLLREAISPLLPGAKKAAKG